MSKFNEMKILFTEEVYMGSKNRKNQRSQIINIFEKWHEVQTLTKRILRGMDKTCFQGKK